MNTQDNLQNNRKLGQVKWFNSKKGYGFITYTQNNEKCDVFVHHTCIKYTNSDSFRNLITGEYVEFDLSPCPGKEGQSQAEAVTGVNGGSLLTEVRTYNNKNKS